MKVVLKQMLIYHLCTDCSVSAVYNDGNVSSGQSSSRFVVKLQGESERKMGAERAAVYSCCNLSDNRNLCKFRNSKCNYQQYDLLFIIV